MMGPPLAPGARLLVRLPRWLGDAVQATPALRALARRVASRHLTLVGSVPVLELLAPLAPGAHAIEASGDANEDARRWRGHDVALLLTGSFRSAWSAWRARVPRRVGWARDGRGWLLTDAARPAREVGRTPLGLGRAGRSPRHLPRPFGASCLELLGLLGVPVPDPRPRLVPAPDHAERVRARLSSFGVDPAAPHAVASVGARPGSAKSYPRWAEALEAFRKRTGLPLVLVAGPGEETGCREVAAALGEAAAWLDPVATLGELAALFAGAAVVLATDSGPRHVAVAVGTPVAAVLGPTDPRHTADFLERQATLRAEVPCGPCHRERCPLEGPERHRCMLLADPAELAARAAALVE